MSKQKNSYKITRSQARALAFQVLYSLEFTKIEELDELKEAFVSTPRVTINNKNNSVIHHEINQDEESEQMINAAPTLDSLPVQEDDIIEDLPNTTVLPVGFTWDIVEGVWTHNKEIDATIQEYAKNWRIDRLGRMELTILRMALFEMLYRDDIPIKVSITEALDLTSQFAEVKAHSFVNGLLDAVHKTKIQQEKK